MEKLIAVLRRFKVRERVLLIGAILVLFYIVIDRAIITPFFTSINETKQSLETKEKLLEKSYSFIANKKRYEERLSELEQYYEKMKKKFFYEETEELASAKLQEIVNNIAKKNGLVVSRSTALKRNIINKNPYLIALSINIEISDIASTEELRNFLYDIEYDNDKTLFIDNLRIKVLGVTAVKGAVLNSTLTAVAFIEKKS
ncbi:general secretion pathway protein M [Candidatus Kuenenia stuttgartiensis]|jgi:hypothetical protein|uniref:General secretion pathway protein M n=1 Tax=Kuenenia stuttgartiensis TaxID=174633 RepID=Q1Q6D6_KUEST|nr:MULTISPECIES: type II secretion system protein GspM [Kuenenia]MBE7548370.1 hypothetical protein [Planctomycetia bacterium]MBZ0192411.1 type II secretion system protein M [Candidatus Kuenenia stuttgartiensis]MCF6150784.1 hypothetical protein [Candidatus Kuenenia stuttgartiensis]MCL4726306.1 hypothetical protein [Candidatus Kuenenia stuttgartiensis]MCZ7620971.1 type II secretion system protein GspM [Candidatus Kuenenia sp.]